MTNLRYFFQTFQKKTVPKNQMAVDFAHISHMSLHLDLRLLFPCAAQHPRDQLLHANQALQHHVPVRRDPPDRGHDPRVRGALQHRQQELLQCVATQYHPGAESQLTRCPTQAQLHKGHAHSAPKQRHCQRQSQIRAVCARRSLHSLLH